LNETIELNNVTGDIVHPACIDIGTTGDSHREPTGTVRQVSHPFVKSVDPRVKRLKARRLSNRKKNLPTNGWRLNDVEFEKLDKLYHFTVEGCCDPSGLNRHGTLPFYSELNSLLDNDVSGESIYCNPPWSLAVACVQHKRACHAKAPMDTKAVIVSPCPIFSPYHCSRLTVPSAAYKLRVEAARSSLFTSNSKGSKRPYV